MSGGAPSLDQRTLTPIVRRALGSETLDVERWDARLLVKSFNPITVGLYRVTGTALDGGASRPWSVVLKVCRDPGRDAEPFRRWYWKREFLAYGSGLLDGLPDGLRPPGCFGTAEQPDGTAWIWLEELRDAYGSPWPVERYGLAARHAGRFNGAYLVGQPLPEAPWLSRRQAHDGFLTWALGFARLPAIRDHPLVRRNWPDPGMRERMVGLFAEREAVFAALERLPQTLAHLDLFKLNAFAVRGADGADRTVAVDWAFVGRAPLGEELAPLVYASIVLADADPERTRELGETAFAGYLAGLRDAGWRGDAGLVRLGYALGLLVRYSIAPLGVMGATDAETTGRAEQAWGRSIGEFLDRAVPVIRYTLDLVAETRAAAATLGCAIPG